jgi:hypothetical protein
MSDLNHSMTVPFAASSNGNNEEAVSKKPKKNIAEDLIHATERLVRNPPSTKISTKSSNDALRDILLRPIAIVAIWLLIGTIFYAYRDGFGLAKGFYYACVIGHSIGYGVLKDPDDGSYYFTILYNLCGVFITSGYVALMLRWMTEGQSGWKVTAAKRLKAKDYEEINPDIFKEDFTTTFNKVLKSLINAIKRFSDDFLDKHFGVFCCYILFLLCWSCRYSKCCTISYEVLLSIRLKYLHYSMYVQLYRLHVQRRFSFCFLHSYNVGNSRTPTICSRRNFCRHWISYRDR